MKRSTTAPLTVGQAKVPKRNDDRIILHFDYDCFYASVFENANPALKGQPLGIQQKSILATCNYVARARGVKKLMLISEAQRICPDLVVAKGEDLTPFRDASKRLWAFLRAHSWNGRVERLGLDEVFLDVTDVVAYNQELLNRHALADSFFQLSRRDPEKGFSFDGRRFFGCVYPPAPPPDRAEADDASSGLLLLPDDSPLCVRLMLASHLAGYLRRRLEEDFGYTASGGVSTNKVLAKLAGSVNKPRNQTTLLSLRDDDVQNFVDAHQIRKIPGIGWRTAQLIQDHMLSTTITSPHEETKITVREVREHPTMSPDLLERILTSRPGAERGSGDRVWGLLHGVDSSAVKDASPVPTQLSIEDTYMARPLRTSTELIRELQNLATSLVRRMRADLLFTDADADLANADNASQQQQQRWAAYPRTLRLSTRTRPTATTTGTGTSNESSYTRTTRSQPLPRFALDLKCDIRAIAERLVVEALLPLFRRLHPERAGWNLSLLNVCVTNMVVVAGADDSGHGGGIGGVGGSGRDIGRMFRTQEDKLREWTVYDDDDDATPAARDTDEPACDTAASDGGGPGNRVEEWGGVGDGGGDRDGGLDGRIVVEEEEPAIEATVLLDGDGGDTWDDDAEESQACRLCGHAIPIFAVSAHERFHAMGD
ncbi:DNA/RNA polymerase [Xylariaceae sp. FL0662B]|nr:DNA/RNA polymerase [Xylariaceae sp. FL0662B]